MKPRIVLKVGSNLLTNRDGTLNVTRMSSFVDQIAELREMKYDVIFVSSGAVASGRGELKARKSLDSVQQRQLYSAVGQVKLMNLYYDLFREKGIKVGQVLTMKENFSTRQEYLNQRNCMTVMLENGVLPIVNENDTLSITELMFTDNDELSGLIASMLDAKLLILLTNVDGIYRHVGEGSASSVVRRVGPDDDFEQYLSSTRSSAGRGGMFTKCNTARKMAAEGIRTCIANGETPHIICDLVTRPEECLFTEFLPGKKNLSSVKKWIAHSEGFIKGVVTVNNRAAMKLLDEQEAVSLLPVGIEQVVGDFKEGDIIRIVQADGSEIALGRAAYGADEARLHLGEHNQKPLVHYDYLFHLNGHDSL